MLIDIHVHCSKHRHPKVSRPDGSQYPTPERLIAMLDDAGIDAMLAISHQGLATQLEQDPSVWGRSDRHFSFAINGLRCFREILDKLTWRARAHCLPFCTGLPIARRGRFAAPP